MEKHKCKRCGRVLKDIKSITRGFGKHCWERSQLEPDLISLLEEQQEKTSPEVRYRSLLMKQLNKHWNGAIAVNEEDKS